MNLESSETIAPNSPLPSLLVSAAAMKAMELYLEHPEARGRVLRLHVNGKNCDGFTYGISFSEWEMGDQVIQLAPTIDLLIDEQTLGILETVTIDWSTADDDGSKQSGFIISNSAEVQGHFKGKFWKRPAGQEFLSAKGYTLDNL